MALTFDQWHEREYGTTFAKKYMDMGQAIKPAVHAFLDELPYYTKYVQNEELDRLRDDVQTLARAMQKILEQKR